VILDSEETYGREGGRPWGRPGRWNDWTTNDCRPRQEMGDNSGVRWEAGAPMKKYLTWALIAFVIFYLLNSPNGAAHVVHNALGGLVSAGNSLSRFVNAL
jgi:hypothetical protein